MVTPENSILNARTAARNVRATLGLPDDQKAWTYAQRATFNKALAAEILRYPNSFTQSTLDLAAQVARKSYADLADASFSWGDFTAETASNAVPVLDNFTKQLFGILTVAAVVYFAVLALRHSPRRQ